MSKDSFHFFFSIFFNNFCHIFDNLHIFYRHPHLAIIAHFLLFQYDQGMLLDSEENIANYLQHAYRMGPHVRHNFGGLKTLSFVDIQNLVSTLNSMARFFAQHVVWKDIDQSETSSNVSSPASSDGGSPTSTDLIPRYFFISD